MEPTDRVLGADEAVVTLVEYGDFQCPFCRATTPVIKRLMAEHKGRLRLVWKDSPLPSHPDARPAAEAARCAADQGKFWDYHDKLFDNQKSLNKGKLRDYAKQVKLDQAAFDSCVNGGTHANPTYAGDTLYAMTDVLAKADLPNGAGALRTRLLAVKNQNPEDEPLEVRINDEKTGKDAYHHNVVLDLDMWVLVPKRER